MDGRCVGKSRARYKITLAAPAGEPREASDRRMRAALKALLRQFGLKCERASGIETPKQPGERG
jgi:hypothetical protein